MCERILAQNCQKFDNFNFEFSMSHHNAHYQSYKNAPIAFTAYTVAYIARYIVLVIWLYDFMGLYTSDVYLHGVY